MGNVYFSFHLVFLLGNLLGKVADYCGIEMGDGGWGQFGH